jgi:hypothetical protein
MSNGVRIPSYRRHKPTVKAVVTLDGRDTYLGRFYSAEAQQACRQLIAEYPASHGLVQQPTSNLTIAELLVAFLRYAKSAHFKKEQQHFLYAMKPLRDLYVRKSVKAFGPLKLKTVRH